MIQSALTSLSSLAGTAGEKLATAPLRAAGEVPAKATSEPGERVAALPLVDVGGINLQVLTENVALRTEYAGTFNGAFNALQHLPATGKALGVRVDSSLGRLDISLADDSLLGRVGLNEPIAAALQPAIRTFARLRLQQLEARPALLDRLQAALPPEVAHNPAVKFVFEPTAAGLRQFAGWEQKCLGFAAEHGLLITAKRVDYLVGSQYVEGIDVKIPVVGSFNQLLDKAQLGVEIDGGDVVNVAGDVLTIVSFAFAPAGLPFAAGARSMALRGSALVNASHNGIVTGCHAWRRTGDLLKASHAAGEAIAEGAVAGAVSGVTVFKAVGPLQASLRTAAAARKTGESLLPKAQLVRDEISLQSELRRVAALPTRLEESGVLLRRELLERALAIEPSVEARLEALIRYAQEGSWMSRHGGYLKGRLAHYARELKGADGVERNLLIIGGKAETAKGQFAELGRAFYIRKSGQEIAAIGRRVHIDGLGHTDIDVLTRSGKWIENKHVRHIPYDDVSRLKIDKMAEAVTHGIEITGPGGPIRIVEAIFINKGTIDSRLTAYAREKGVQIHQNVPYTRALPMPI